MLSIRQRVIHNNTWFPERASAWLVWFANVTNFHDDVFVLWGQGFDEIAASIFVVELRRLSIRVKLVGLKSQHIAGQHGLTLMPDLTLGQALRRASRLRCLVIPAPPAALRQFSYDPRLAELLRLVESNQALVVAAPPTPTLLPEESKFLPNIQTTTYPILEELKAFIDGVVLPHQGRNQ